MNPYSDLAFPLPSAITAADDIISSSSAPVPPFYSTLILPDQSVQPSQQMDQLELCNPCANVFSSSVPDHDELSTLPVLVRPETVNININTDCFRSADRTDKLDTLNPHGLSIIAAQLEAEETFTSLDLECLICFSQFNNAFRCPKQLQCGHTFCLECLARMNVKSTEPGAVQCPLCRAHTLLPALGLPQLSTDPQVLSRLPSSMQRVYSVRFLRNKGRLQLKRPDATTLTQSMRRSVDVGLPSPVPRSAARGRATPSVAGSLFRLTDRPACRALLLTAIIAVIVLLTATIVFLLTNSSPFTP